MKNILLFIAAFFLFLSAGAQITQYEADSIAIQSMGEETRQYTIYATQNLQTEFAITTTKEEVLELKYSCWVYYVSFVEDTTANHYLIMKESNGSVLQVNPKNNTITDDLAEWRVIGGSIEVPFMEYILGDSCQRISVNYSNDTVILINSNEELENYIECIGDIGYPDIDFSTHTLLLAFGIASSSIVDISCNSLQQCSEQSYKMYIDISLGHATVLTNWQVPIVVDKLDATSIVDLKVKYVF
jgi:hypothetical protein